MPTIRITRNDINEMVRSAVRSIMLNESVKEVQGSIMAEKDDVIEELVNYVKDEWKRIRENGVAPSGTDTFTLNDGNGPGFKGKENIYIILIPGKITKRLGIAENFQVNVGILDYLIPKDKLDRIGRADRATEGTSYWGPEYSKFVRTTMKVTKGRIDLMVPAISGELQVTGFYSTLYHELNHSASNVELKRKHSYITDDDELNGLNFTTATSRKGVPPHDIVMSTMNPDPNDIMTILQGLFSTPEDRAYEEQKRKMSFVFYSIWETTERNARAEAIYGDLKALGATRGNFSQVYKETELYRQINELKDMIDSFENEKTPSKIWSYAANVMGMGRRGKNERMGYKATNRYHEAVKQRFLDRSRELLDMLYRKGMKVAELYFQRTEPKKEPTRLERYKQEHNK